MSSVDSTWAVVVSWNVADLLRECLKSLASITPRPGVVVVDNGSTDGTPGMILREFPGVVLIANPGNAGFAHATNQGVRAALDRGATRLLLLNPDATLPPETLPALEQALDADASIGLLAPAIVTPDGAPQAFAFGGDPTLPYLLRRGLRRMLHRAPIHDWDSRTEVEPDWVTGACILVRADVFHREAWMDPEFFLYFEDNDWCLRVRRAGWRIRRHPDVHAIHQVGGSLKRNPESAGSYVASLLRFYDKHYPHWQGWLVRRLRRLYIARC